MLSSYHFLVFGFGTITEAKNTAQNFEKAKHLFIKQEWAKAKNQFLAIKNKASNSKEGKRSSFLLALLQLQSNKHKRTIEILTPLIKNYPEIQDYILLNLAKAEIQNKDFEKAQTYILRLLKNFPETQLYLEAQIILAETYSQTNSESKATIIFQKTISSLSKLT